MAGAFLTLMSLGASAQFTAQQIDSICKAKEIECIFYMTGLRDGLTSSRMAKAFDQPGICIPDGESPASTARLLSNFLERYPDLKGDSALTVLHIALSEAFPCND